MKRTMVLITFFIFFSLGLILYISIFKNKSFYQEEYIKKTNTYISGISAPRGKILDCKGRVLVDNVGIKTIVYRKDKDTSSEEELEIAKKLVSILNISEESTETDLKHYFLTINNDYGRSLITEEELRLYNERKLTSHDLYLLKLERIKKSDLDSLSNLDKKIAYIYSLMNKGYYNDFKIIKRDVSESEYAKILELNIKGISSEMDYKRIYPYGSTLRSILGNVGKIPVEKESIYLEKNIPLDELVGISYLEEEYDDYLRGKKDIYKVLDDNSLSLYEKGSRGNDLVLSIDIDMQLEIENILKEEIKKGKSHPSAKYYQGSYVLVGNSLDGSIKVVAGLKYLGKDVFKNVEVDNFNNSFTVGSIIKGASLSFAYQNNLVELDKLIKDGCVKLYLNPTKCSYKRLGYINDITALKTSSNYYQFLLAIKYAGYKYTPNLKMNINEDIFNDYRNAFASFGLGVKTGIDIPNENTGIKGNKVSPDLLLNYVIGQYDTYTTLGLLQYINTIHNNGNRYALSLMQEIISPDGNILVKNNRNLLSTFKLENKYFERIKLGLSKVVSEGTGVGYIDSDAHAYGKTGTSQTIFENKEVIHNTFALVLPTVNYSMVVVSPSVSYDNFNNKSYLHVNRLISKRVSDYLLKTE